jgi:hypothetical protein
MLQYTHNNTNSGNPIRLIPAPFVSVSREQNRNANGEIIGQMYVITLTGKTLPYKGNPSSAGAWETSALWISSENSGDDPIESLQADGGNYTSVKWMESLLKKEKAIREAFSYDGGLLEIVSPGSAPGNSNTLKCRPRVTAIDFAGGQYIGPNEYTITLEADFVYGLGDASTDTKSTPQTKYNILDSSESWDIEEDEEFFYFTDAKNMSSGASSKAYRISRNISATGKPIFGSAKDGKVYTKGGSQSSPFDTSVGGHAWQQARGYVLDKASTSTEDTLFQQASELIAGNATMANIRSIKDAPSKEDTLFNPLDATEVLNNSGSTQAFDSNWVIYNHVRTQSVDEKGGSFSVTESFIIMDASRVASSPFALGAPASEEMNIDVNESLDSSLVEITINGTVRGLENTSPQSAQNSKETARYDNAVSYFAQVNDNLTMSTRAANLSGVTITNTNPTSKQIGRSPKDGSITYAFTFNNRPIACLSGAVSEEISINDTHPGNIVASTPVIGRAKGPVLQYLGSNSGSTRTLSISAVFSVDFTAVAFCSNLNTPASNLTAARALAATIRPVKATNTVYDTEEAESWNPKTGAYTYNIAWTYECNSGCTQNASDYFAAN